MKHLSLAAKYRPQTFSEVVGQELAIAALSRAAAENRVAPAYLLSGTRGVGKTTVARIFAKALNCEKGPGPEPCNACRQCAEITAGNHVDVNEIDGASNTGVDDVRALRENIGYMPMEGRYKIFIVDEAHMLSKSAFNALLKTLEEPPAHTVFIFATTEAHRFPATIVSRCQHFVFRHLPEEAIYSHLRDILNKENFQFEDEAARIIAARAAGSARDSLSLLDQTLSLCSGVLDAKTARESLGLAGREFFEKLFAAVAGGDCLSALTLARELLNSGADIGYFARELSGRLRNLFLYRQIGDRILPTLALSPDETESLRRLAPTMTPAHLHAAWQMTLENQRSVAQNPDPGSALELLLINLAILPRLLPVGKVPFNAPGANAGPAREAESPPFPAPSHPEAVEPPRGANELCWEGFCEFCRREGEAGLPVAPREILRQVKADWRQDRLEIRAGANTLFKRLLDWRKTIEDNLKKYCGGSPPPLALIEPAPTLSPEELKSQAGEDKDIDLVKRVLTASVEECQPKTTNAK